MRKSPNRLNLQQTLELSAYMEKNRDTLQGLSAPEISAKATKELGFVISDVTIYKVGAHLGLVFSRTKPSSNKQFKECLLELAQQILDPDNPLLTKIRNLP